MSETVRRPPIRPGEVPEELILDPDTRLEKALTMLGCLPFFAVLTTFPLMLSGEPIALWSGAILFFLGCFVMFLRVQLDDYYILDFAQRKVLFHRGFLSQVSRQPRFDFEELWAISIETRRRRSRNGIWWDYGLALYPWNGPKIVVNDPRDIDYELACFEGEKLSKLLEIPFMAGGPEKLTKVGGSAEGPELQFEPYGLTRDLPILLVLLVAFVVVCLVQSVGVVEILSKF